MNIQFVKAKSLADSPSNPRVAALADNNDRGTIYAADGTVLAKSVPTPAGTNRTDYPYDYVRQYPQGPLYAGITGFDSALYFGKSDIEDEYDADLRARQQAPQTLSQLIFREKQPMITDNVTLTVEPALQQAAWNALTSTPGNNDGAVVVLNPKTGAVLAMVSNPTYDPNALVSTSLSAEQLAYFAYNQKDHEGYFPLRPLATGETFFPGSTMKVVTSTAAYNLKPSLVDFDYPIAPCQGFSDSNKLLCNDGSSPSNATPCGGTMVAMLPASCDPGYGELGIQEGVATLRQQAELFGINSLPGIDLPSNAQQSVGGVVPSTIQTLPSNAQAYQAYTAIGQYGVKDTVVQNAMVAAGIANGGVIMTPHLMSSIRDSQGALVQTYKPTPMPRSASTQAAQAVTALMESVPISGTADKVGFPSYLCAAVKTGTAQTGLGLNHDWMIGFAPANDPQIAVAVVVPFQNISSDGAGVAGPIMNKVMQAALPPGSVSQPCTVAPVPASTFTSGH
ncbi:MAG: penicillin-binding transpeptidase domain-containing protein [Acidimicrobiales bacterium]